jgi:hypothetical protein
LMLLTIQHIDNFLHSPLEALHPKTTENFIYVNHSIVEDPF